jgi:hypothetical protein
MHKLLIVLMIVGLFGCNIKTKNQKDENAVSLSTADTGEVSFRDDYDKNIKNTDDKPDFDRYIESLDKIILPLSYSAGDRLPDLSTKFHKPSFNKYKRIWTTRPIGILYKNDKSVVTLEVSVGDYGYAPFLMTYDLEGNKIDSIRVFKKTGRGLGYENIEYLVIKENREFLVADSLKKWKVRNGEVLKDSLTIKLDTTYYRIDEIGEINRK